MKGFASEALILSGAYCFTFSSALSIVLLALGCLGAVFRYTTIFGAQAKKDQLLDLVSVIVKKVVESPPVYQFDLSQFRKETDEVH